MLGKSSHLVYLVSASSASTHSSNVPPIVTTLLKLLSVRYLWAALKPPSGWQCYFIRHSWPFSPPLSFVTQSLSRFSCYFFFFIFTYLLGPYSCLHSFHDGHFPWPFCLFTLWMLLSYDLYDSQSLPLILIVLPDSKPIQPTLFWTSSPGRPADMHPNSQSALPLVLFRLLQELSWSLHLQFLSYL